MSVRSFMPKSQERVSKIVGLGGNSGDGHIRITNGDGYQLVQGSEQTHDDMIKWCEEINQRLARLNKSMHQLSVDEFMALAREAAPRT